MGVALEDLQENHWISMHYDNSLGSMVRPNLPYHMICLSMLAPSRLPDAVEVSRTGLWHIPLRFQVDLASSRRQFVDASIQFGHFVGQQLCQVDTLFRVI